MTERTIGQYVSAIPDHGLSYEQQLAGEVATYGLLGVGAGGLIAVGTYALEKMIDKGPSNNLGAHLAIKALRGFRALGILTAAVATPVYVIGGSVEALARDEQVTRSQRAAERRRNW